MRTKAIVKGEMLLLSEPIKFNSSEIEIDISDRDIAKDEFNGRQSFSEAIRETIGKFPEDYVDWKKQWHRHLEEKYHG